MDNRFDLESILGSLNPEKLRDLVKHLMENNSDVRHLTLEWYRKMHEISDGSLPDESPYHVDDELLMEYWSYASCIISEFNEYGGGDEEEEDEAYEWLNKISDLIEEGNISHDTKIAFMEEAFVEYDKYNSGYEDSLAEIFFELCQTDEEWRYLVTKLRRCPSDWRNKLVMDILRDNLQDDTAYLELRLKKLEYGNDYWELASFYAERGNMDKAIETAEMGLLEGKGRLTELFVFLFEHYAQKKDIPNAERIVHRALELKHDEKIMLDNLFGYYRSQGNYQKARDALLKSFTYAGRSEEYKEYQRIKTYLKNDDWSEVEPELFSSLRDRNMLAYLRICMDKGMKEEVISKLLAIPKAPDRWDYLNDFDKLALELKAEYPKEVIEYYWKKAYCNVPGGTRKTYRIAEGYLEIVRDIYVEILQDRPAWDNRFNSLKAEFKSRPAFLDEVKGL
jgi:hypothetical protein